MTTIMQPYRIIDPEGLTAAFVEEWHNSQDYITARTSGSTGKPKEIRLLKTDMELSARATCHRFGIGRGSVLFCPLSTEYIAGKMMIVRAAVAGATVVVERPSATPMAHWTLGPADLAAIVPSQIEGLLGNGCDRLRSVIVGGAPTTTEQERIMIESGIDFHATYGMTETCSHVALRRFDSKLFEALPGFCFHQDDRGCLVIESESMSFGRLVTNDMVRLHDNISFQWLGRYDNVIISGGIKLFPEEIELEIAPYLRSHAFYLTGRPSERWGEELVMVIEGEHVDIEAIDRELSLHIEHCHKPKGYIVNRVLPRTPTGKLLRHRIK